MRVEVTNPERVLYPAAGFTKADLVAYYVAVAPVLLPHLAERPLTLGRWPAGVEARGFAQTECRGRPPGMRVRELRLRGGEVRRHCLLDDVDGVAWVANQGAIELHVFPGSGDPEEPAHLLLLDLDPGPDAQPDHMAQAALALRGELARRGLDAVVKTSGAAGLHVAAPLEPAVSYERARSLARELARRLGGGPVSVDWRRNHPRQTLVAPYSLRAMDVPLASAPLAWEELERGLPAFTAAELPERIARHGDLYAAARPPGAANVAQSPP